MELGAELALELVWLLCLAAVDVSTAAILAEVDGFPIWPRVWILISSLTTKSVKENSGLPSNLTRLFSSSWNDSHVFQAGLEEARDPFAFPRFGDVGPFVGGDVDSIEFA